MDKVVTLPPTVTAARDCRITVSLGQLDTDAPAFIYRSEDFAGAALPPRNARLPSRFQPTHRVSVSGRNAEVVEVSFSESKVSYLLYQSGKEPFWCLSEFVDDPKPETFLTTVK